MLQATVHPPASSVKDTTSSSSSSHSVGEIPSLFQLAVQTLWLGFGGRSSSCNHPESSAADSTNHDSPIAIEPLQSLREVLTLPTCWILQAAESGDKLQIYKLNSNPSSSKQSLVVTHCLTVLSDLTWSLCVHSHTVTAMNCSILTGIPEHLTAESISVFVKLLDTLKVCPGNPDRKFVEFVQAKKGVLSGHNQQPVARLDDYAPVTVDGNVYSQTVRPLKCEMLVPFNKCGVCNRHRNTLRTISNRYNSRSKQTLSDSSSHSNYRYLNTPEKKARLTNLSKRMHKSEKELKKFKAKIQQLTDKSGVYVDDELHSDLVATMKENSNCIVGMFPEESFANLFWKEQMKAASLKNSHQMRWHPLMIRWCINLKLISSAAYHATRTAGFIKLPSERTLRDYTSYFNHQAGFQAEVLEQLQKESKGADLPSIKAFCGFAIDEIKIREGLVFHKRTDEICGFCNIGDINNQLLALEKQCESRIPDIAKHMLVIMVRGLFFKLDFPLAHFACSDLTGEQIFLSHGKVSV